MADSAPKTPPLTPTSFHILLALVDEPLHGYAVMQRLAELGMQVGPGTVYGALSRMEQSGWVEETSVEPARGPSGQRQRYGLTKAGLQILRADASRVVQAADLIRSRHLLEG